MPPPEYGLVLRRPLEWRLAADTPELHDPARGEWVKLAPWTRHVLEGLAARETLPQLNARLAQQGESAVPEARVRRFLQSLTKVGYLDVQVPGPREVGPCDVLEELGRGGVGIAYLARDRRDGAEVVLKRAWGFLNRLEAAQEALRREARLLEHVRHPNIVRAHGLVEEAGEVYLARELVRGASLSELHDARPVQDRAELLARLEAAASCLTHLHGRGILLLDYKPGNFFVEDGTGRLVLMDVGHAEDTGPALRVQLRAPRGTPGFMPPEVARERRADVRSDVWGLGRLLAFLTSGRLFRRGEVSLADVVQELPKTEADLVSHLCAEDPQERPSAVVEAMDAIRLALR